MKKRRGHIGRKRPHSAVPVAENSQPLNPIYLSGTNDALRDSFIRDPHAKRSGSALKWLVSTCIAAMVGVTAIGMALYASMDIENDGNILDTLQKVGIDGMKPVKRATVVSDTLRVASRKTSRLVVTSYGLSTKYTIHDRVAQKRGDREFIVVKPYSKIVASLSTAIPQQYEVYT